MKLINAVRFVVATLVYFFALTINASALDTDGDGVSNFVAIKVSAGQSHTCALDATGVHCWGANDYHQLDVPTLSNPRSVIAAKNYSCAIDDSGLHCWGDNQFNQLDFPNLSTPTQVTATAFHTCALDDTGAHCWGLPSDNRTDVPNTLTSPIAITAGGYHTCVIDAGVIKCWGLNDRQQTTVPNSLANPMALSAGAKHTCVIDLGIVKCWGDDTYGQSSVPVTVTNPAVLSAGAYHTCVIDIDTVKCWGANTDQQRIVPTLSNPTIVSAGFAHTCASDANGVHCWGRNTQQQSDVPVLTQAQKDNCPLIANPDQLDSDNDQVGDACDVSPHLDPNEADTDNDGVPDSADAFPLDPSESVDTDNDSIGNNSDADDDNDGESDFVDPLPLNIKLTRVFYSVGSKDGWLLESTETSKKGRTKNSLAATLMVGDTAKNQEYRSILHFDTTVIPDNAVIVKAVLKLKRQGKKGDVKVLGNLIADMRQKNFGSSSNLESKDFEAKVGKKSAIKFKAIDRSYSATLNSADKSYISKIVATQFRLHFAKDDNNDNSDDYLKFYSGNASTSVKPSLTVEYYIP